PEHRHEGQYLETTPTILVLTQFLSGYFLVPGEVFFEHDRDITRQLVEIGAKVAVLVPQKQLVVSPATEEQQAEGRSTMWSAAEPDVVSHGYLRRGVLCQDQAELSADTLPSRLID
ncbi:hypothetical protein TGVEG_442060, partial [Toxoplasma gondii VEG]